MDNSTQSPNNTRIYHSIETTSDEQGATYIKKIVFYERDVIGETLHPNSHNGKSFWEAFEDRISFESQDIPTKGAETAVFNPPLSLDEFIDLFGNTP